MKKYFCYIIICLFVIGCSAQTEKKLSADEFIRVNGPDLTTPNGEKFFIKGTNLGNWLNPEGYMFGFSKTNSARQINEMFWQKSSGHSLKITILPSTTFSL